MFFLSLLVGTLKSALNQLSLEQADVRTAPLSQWRLDDSSFLARLLFPYIAVTKTWKEAGNVDADVLTTERKYGP